MTLNQITDKELDRAMRAYLGECCNAGESKKAMETRLTKFAGERLDQFKPQLDGDLDLVVNRYNAVAEFDPIEDFDRSLDQAFEVTSEVLPAYTAETRRKLAIHCVYQACATR
jgi:hypothetical protein